MKDLADRIIDHYERHACDWDADRNRYVSPWNDKPWHDRFIAALPRDAAVLDLGCGSGAPVAEYMVERGLRVCPGLQAANMDSTDFITQASSTAITLLLLPMGRSLERSPP